MNSRAENRKADLIAKVEDKVRERLSPDLVDDALGFVRAYFANVPPHDMEGADADAGYGAAISLFTFVRQRPEAGRAKVRAFNPRFEDHGWSLGHTVIETVTDDMPFLVDSITAELNRLDLLVHLVIHPVVPVTRDQSGRLCGVGEGADTGARGGGESCMHIEVNEQSDPDVLSMIEQRLETVFADVRAAVEDWPAMRERAVSVTERLETPPEAVSAEEAAEVRDFLCWLHDDHFTFLGYRDYAFENHGEDRVTVDPETGLGVLRDPQTMVFNELGHLEAMPEYVRGFVQNPTLLLITKGNRRSTVHRPVHMDVIGVKRFDADGLVCGMRAFVGLFTADVYTNSPTFVPVLRRKMERAMRRAGFAKFSHDGKKLLNILENLPRDELFQSSDDELFDMAMGILHLQERQRTALFTRHDEFERFVSCLVFVPRDRYDTPLRHEVMRILSDAWQGRISAYYTQVVDSPLARLHFIVGTDPGKLPRVDEAEVERKIAEAARSWPDHLCDALVRDHGEEKGLALFDRYGKAFPAAYRDHVSAKGAVVDIAKLEEVRRTGRLGMNLYRPMEAAEREVRFKIYHPDRAVPLSGILPMLENMGFLVEGEVPYPIVLADGEIHIHDFIMQAETGIDLDVASAEARERFHEAFERIWRDAAENDGFNRLVVAAGLDWRETALVRALAKYLRQAGVTLSQSYLEETLARHAEVVRPMVGLFHALHDPDHHDPDHHDDNRARDMRERIAQALDAIESAEEDRIVRRFVNLIDCTLRTNYYQRTEDGGPKPYLSLKIDSRRVEGLPLPRPMVEIFVCSPRVEAVHLRGGKVARGGIRWSDRREDFRTEVLGLMKAQMVKNAVIVPVGAKGGFVVKRPPPEGGREAQQAEAIACYKDFMRGLLDITDNYEGSEVVPRERVVRLDGDDPYLVVAADKGTATFSDIANGIALDYGHWLGDAFASGGSKGYDHKAMGITAKGAWEAVKRHFREMGKDIQSEDFTVIGCGDMSGDVFGNGMLLSRRIKLLAAFNHMHVFVDPDPDPEASFKERERLFALPRSGWADYSTEVLSKGGRIYERKAKSVTLTPEIRARFGIDRETMTPNELIALLLKAEAELLWFGGIGTYVKHGTESDAEVGDRANDAIRVDADDLRCKVIGEGANLGVTQRGRIQFALGGGRINTDAIDNSAGVDCSDHEVNIKILLGAVERDGELTEKQRNSLLESMTDEVSTLVLRDNYLQTQAISLVEAQGGALLDYQDRLIRLLERQGRIDRQVDDLPEDEEIAERLAARKGLTRPEIAVLVSHAKIWLFDEILESELPDDPVLVDELHRYFPTPLTERFKDYMAGHRLKREIIATQATNSMINRVGGSFVSQLTEKTGMPPAEIARAYLVARDAYGLRAVWERIEALDTKVPARLQAGMMREANRLIERATLWLLRFSAHPIDVGTVCRDLTPAVEAVGGCLDAVISPDVAETVKRRADAYAESGVPEDLATEVAGLVVLASVPDIQRVARQMDVPIETVARVYFSVGDRFGIGRLRAQAETLALGDHWQKLAVAAQLEELYNHQRDVTTCVLAAADTPPDDPAATDQAIDAWIEANRVTVDRADQLMTELTAADGLDLARLMVASRQFRAMTGC